MALMRDERGFSLPEVMAALLILTIVITVSFTAFLERNRRLQQASEIIMAWQALANEAEYQRRVEFDDLSSLDEFLSETMVLEPLKPYETAVEVEEVDDGVLNVTLSVSWRDGERSESLTLVRVDTGGPSRLW
jgi:prepilin-type N-terminal cleavage/methylation domain-containing protein